MITINVIEEKLWSTTESNDGWHTKAEKSFLMAEYVQSGETLFSLRCEKPHEVSVYIRKEFDSCLRIGIHYGLMLALYQDCVSVHGVTLLCGQEIIILSAPSGTGKTTLGKLLEKYCDAIIINGDFALLSPTEEGAIFEPSPFCGTSGRSLNHRFRINRVVFLGQAEENRWYELSGREAMTRFMSNAFIPTWDNNMQRVVQENILRCISMLQVNAYDFAPTQEAAEEFLKHVKGDHSLYPD